MIRQRSQADLRPNRQSQPPFVHLSPTKYTRETADSNELKLWVLETLEPLDVGPLEENRESEHARDKAPTPSQEIIEQTKASWKEKNRDSTKHKQTFSLPLDIAFDSRHSEKRGLAHAKSLRNTHMSSRSIWSDLEATSGTDKTCRSSKQSTMLSQKLSPQRQTRTFSGISSKKESSVANASSKASGASQRLQAILGVDSKRHSANKGENGRRVTSSAPLKTNSPRSPTRTSRLLPVYDRRESSVYGFGGPMTPPPTSPLPSIPISESQNTLHTSSTTPLVLYTPVSPAATVNSNANHWSWRLGPDSPGSQMLNDMKNATDISRSRRSGENVLPTKRHVHQRSISSSLASAAMLETTIEEDSVRAHVADVGRRSRKEVEETYVVASPGGPNPSSKSDTWQDFDNSPMTSHQGSSTSAINAKGSNHQDPNATTNSAGSPSSIIDLYMSRSKQSTVAGRSI